MFHDGEAYSFVEHGPRSDDEERMKPRWSRVLVLICSLVIVSYVGKLSFVGSSEKAEVGFALQRDEASDSQQKLAFTAWINEQLKELNVQIDDLGSDLRDGLKLMLLLEEVSGTRLPKPERGRLRFHLVSNVNKALDFLASHGANVGGIGAEEIVDGDVTVTLDLIWRIILRFAIEDGAAGNPGSEDALLAWVQRETAPYEEVNVKVFDESFKDGRAFCALLHSHGPDLIDCDALSKRATVDRLNTAFEVAEKAFNVPKMLDAEDMVKVTKPDARSVETYLCSLYRVLSPASSPEVALAAEHIVNILTLKTESKDGVEDYRKFAQDVIRRMNTTISELSNRTRGSFQDLQTKLLMLEDDHVNSEQLVDDLNRLDTMFNMLETEWRLSHQPSDVLSECETRDDIQKTLRTLEGAKTDLYTWIDSQWHQLRRSEALATRIKLKCEQHDAWCNRHRKVPENHGSVSSEHVRVKEIVALGREFKESFHLSTPEVDSCLERVMREWDELKDVESKKHGSGSGDVDKFWSKFDTKVTSFSHWMDGAIEGLRIPITADTVEDVQDELDVMRAAKANLPSAQEKRDAILALELAITKISTDANPYTSITSEDVQERWGVLQAALTEREGRQADEMSLQQSRELLRVQFATLANDLGKAIQTESQALHDVLFAGETLEDLLQEYLDRRSRYHVRLEANIHELIKISKQTAEAWIFENPHLTSLAQVNWIRLRQLEMGIAEKVSVVNDTIWLRDGVGIPSPEVKELYDSFTHFDKDSSTKLEHSEFRQLVKSLGVHDVDRDGLAIEHRLDPCGRGLDFDDFLAYSVGNVQEKTLQNIEGWFRTLSGGKPYVTGELLKKHLPEEKAQYCIDHMSAYTGPDAVPGALVFSF
jgi:actinin alpha